MDKTKFVGIRIDVPDDVLLTKLARNQVRSKNSLIRYILKDYVNEVIPPDQRAEWLSEEKPKDESPVEQHPS